MKNYTWQSESGGFSRRAIGVLLAAIALYAFTAGAVEKSRQRGGANAALADPDRPRAQFVPGELLVGFNPGARGHADEVRKAIGAEKLKEWPALQAQHWRLPPGLDVARAVQVLSANPNVTYAEPNYLFEAAAFPADPPNDPYRGELSGLHNVGQTGATIGADIGALSAWAKQLGSQSVVVAVIDSGIDYTHPDLSANIWNNPGEIPGNGIDDDGNGYVDDVRGWDFVNNDNDPMDDNSHGTHVAGTIGAAGNNGVGVIGVSPVVRLMPLKFLNAGGSGSTDNAISAVLYAASFKDASGNPVVRISNNSWGGGSKSRTLENAIKNCGALFCAAAGNSGSSTVAYPAGYTLANIVAVAATDQNDLLASFSNFGSWVHLAAPGVNTLSTVPGASYAVYSGTSMATPHVSGALALLRAEFPSWSNTTLRNRLLANVDTKAALSGKVTSGGRLNVAKALGAAPLPADSVAPDAVTDPALAAEPTQTSVTLSWKATGDDGQVGQAYLYDLRYASAPITPDNWSSAIPVLGEPLPQAPGTTESLTVDELRAGNTYYFALRAIDERGNASPLSAALEATTAASAWTVEVVDGVAGDYNSLAHNSGGQPVIAYNSAGNIKLATRTASGWTSEAVAAGFGGVSLAYNLSGTPAISWAGNSVSGKPTTVLYYADKTGSAWSKTIVGSSDVQSSTTSLAYNPAGQPCISYGVLSGTSAGLRFAWREGNTWKTQTVHSKAGARYNSLAFTPGGKPLIAYSDDANADNQLDTVRLAEGVWNGTSYTWTITTLETGVQGYGVFANVGVDPAGNPVVSHQMRLLQRIGGAWFGELVDEGNGWVPFMTVDNAGNIHLAYDAGFLKVATRPADGSAPWSFSIADAQTYLWWPGSIRVGPDGLPAASYAGDDNESLTRVGLLFAKKNPVIP